jgi:nucleoside-diphosphate kinase
MLRKIIAPLAFATVVGVGAYNFQSKTNVFAPEKLEKIMPEVDCEQKVPFQGLPGTKYERTYIMVKPDGVQRGLVGEIVKRFEQKGFILVGIKMVNPTEELASKHYEDLKAKPFYKSLVNYFLQGQPVVGMVWQGADVVKSGRRLIGETNPLTSPQGTIRGDFGVNIGRNIIHGSDGTDGAQTEIALWFKENEVHSWTPSNEKWTYEK